MLKKIVTTVGLVSVFGASTAMSADIDLSAATFTPIKVSNETLGKANFTTGIGTNKVRPSLMSQARTLISI